MAYLKLSLVLLVAMVVASMNFEFSGAKEVHMVGDLFGWDIPHNNDTVYVRWSQNNHFKVNDQLVFNFAIALHTVAEVTETAYNNCDKQNPISIHYQTPTIITLTRPVAVPHSQTTTQSTATPSLYQPYDPPLLCSSEKEEDSACCCMFRRLSDGIRRRQNRHGELFWLGSHDDHRRLPPAAVLRPTIMNGVDWVFLHLVKIDFDGFHSGRFSL
ncbi:hypothetical protein LXL04_021728 [Taraxacum kok-saghyz]